MLHGNISNHYGYCIAFRCDDFLIKCKEDTLKDKILNTFSNKYKRAEIDKRVYSVMEYLYRNTEYTVALVVDPITYSDKVFKELIDNIPFNNILLISKPSQLAQKILLGEVTYYVDDDPARRELVSAKYSVPISDLSKYIKIGAGVGRKYENEELE